MSDAPTDDLRPAAAAFQKSVGPKMDMLLPHRNAVLELRGKGASFALIARLLEHIGVNVSTDTLRRLCVRTPCNACDAPVLAMPKAGQRAPSATSPSNQPQAPNDIAAPTIRPNVPRGPRIADPRGQ